MAPMITMGTFWPGVGPFGSLGGAGGWWAVFRVGGAAPAHPPFRGLSCWEASVRKLR